MAFHDLQQEDGALAGAFGWEMPLFEDWPEWHLEDTHKLTGMSCTNEL